MKQLFTIAFLIQLFPLFSQTNYYIREKNSNEPVPFAKIISSSGFSILSDIDGIFKLNNDTTTFVKISSMGYMDTIVSIPLIQNFEIYITPISKEIEEITILPGENPAHRIMDLVIANRKKNNPTENDAFRYESYSKFIYDINPEAISSISDSTADSSMLKLKKLFNSQHLMLLESASKRTFIPPSKDKEEIIAYKVSGFTDPMFSNFAHEMQSFSFYDNQFELSGKTYINPIAFGGTKRYLFIIEDTLINNSDTTYTISFRPRKGKNFEGLKGRLFINTNGYALEKVIAEPHDESLTMSIKVVQEYTFVQNKKWFPAKLSTEISFPFLNVSSTLENAYIIGKGNMYIKNIEFNPNDLKKFSFDNTTISTSENANNLNENEWDSLRIYSITKKESKTYSKLDSLSKSENLDYKLSLFKTLLEGKLPLGYINLDLSKIYDYKLYEGHRIGLGFETSKKTLKKVTIGSYFAYGTTDKEWKYGGFSDFHLYPKKSLKLRLAFQQDISERGGTNFQKEAVNINDPEIYRHFYITNMDRQRLAEAVLSGQITSNFKVSFIGNYQRISTTQNYQYFPINAFPISKFDLAQTALEITWNIREKVMLLGDVRISKGTKFPKIKTQIIKGWNNFYDSKFEYWRIYAEVKQDVSIRGAGTFSWLLTGSQSIGDIPLFLSQVSKGTGGNWNLSVKNTFETMLPSEFYSSKQASLFTRFTFTAIKTPLKWCAPQFGIHNAIGYGEIKNSTDHSITFKTLEKGYTETGLICDKLIFNGLSGFGIGTFYKYGAYSSSNWKQNFMFKISLSLSI